MGAVWTFGQRCRWYRIGLDSFWPGGHQTLGNTSWLHSWRDAEHHRVRQSQYISSYQQPMMMKLARVRALGETDLNPVSGLGKISQLFFAWIQPGNIVANIIAGGVAEAGAQQ